MVYILDLIDFTPFVAMFILTSRGQVRHTLVSLFLSAIVYMPVLLILYPVIYV